MVAPIKTHRTSQPRIVCMAVRVEEFPRLRDGSLAARPSTMLPWADPYIAGLVRRLQSEVRFERADLDPPSPVGDSEWEGWDQPRWADGAVE